MKYNAPTVTSNDILRCLKKRLPEPEITENKLRSSEFARIRETLEKTGGNKQQAAELLGIGRAKSIIRKCHNEYSENEFYLQDRVQYNYSQEGKICNPEETPAGLERLLELGGNF